MPAPQPEPIPKVVIKDFAGMISNQDPGDIEPGAGRFQVNVVAERPGELRPRMGWARVSFRAGG